jgi:O-acetyl-ADP-ribose deacetylase (regulator of RNase III)
MAATPRELTVSDRILAIRQGDITVFPVDAIVNAANEHLAGGGGVDGAIHRAGGPQIMRELAERYGSSRRCPTGSAVPTGAGNLPARWVIHAVGPRWSGGSRGEEALLVSAYRSALAIAGELGARHVSLPAISCGIYGYPLTDGARVAIETAADHLATTDGPLERITFVLFSADPFRAFETALAEVGVRPGSPADGDRRPAS